MAWYNPLSWGNTGSTAPLTGAGAVASGTASGLAGERAGLGANPYGVDTTQSATDRAAALAALGGVRAAAAGTTPSPAELQLQQQSANNNAAAFGAAAALKGRTPGASFTTAARQSADNQMQTNATAAQLRAAEMAQARQALLSGTQEQTAQDTQAAQTAAALKSNYANALLGGQLTSQGQAVTAAGGTVSANVANAQTQNSFAGGLIGGAGQAAALVSDEREKTDVSGADAAAAFGKVHGNTFEYEHPGTEGEPAGARVGVMAQDLRKTPIGRMVVVDGKPMKLDIGNALGLALAALGDHEREIEELRGRKAA